MIDHCPRPNPGKYARLVLSEKLSNCAKGQAWMGDRSGNTSVVTFSFIFGE